jgi:thiol-disulfide isomerase/thioredoxin
MRLLLISFAVLALAACSKPEQAPENEATQSEAGVPTKGVDRSHKGEPVPDVEIRDAMSIDTGSTTKLRELHKVERQPMLLNLWASWCAPCVKELPTLDKLKEERAGSLIVLPISEDSGPQRSVEAFLDGHDLDFAAYQDPDMALTSALGVQVMPTTVYYDASGHEVWRYTGDLDWTGDEAARLLAEGATAASAR